MRPIRLRTPRHWRRARRFLVGLAVAGLVVTLFGSLTAGVALFMAALVGLVVLEFAQLRQLIRESDRQHHALVQIRPLLGQLPLDLGGWAADPWLVHNAVRLLIDTRPSLVVECGSGSSTVVLAQCLRTLGRGRVVSIDHDPEYARRTNEMLQQRGLSDVAAVVTAPLADRELDGTSVRWYGAQFEPLIQGPIDVLVVDGPPGNTARMARYPAVPLLQRKLAAECSILMDDGDRPDEYAIAHAWRDLLGARLTYLEGGRGGWLLHRRPGS